MKRGFQIILRLLACLYILRAINDDLFIFSDAITIKLQSYSNIYLDTFFVLTTLLANQTVIALLLLYLFLGQNKKFALQLIIYLSFILYISNLLKILQFEPRPFFVNDEIKPKFCLTELGLPSEHTTISMLFVFIITDQSIFINQTQQTDLAAKFILGLIGLSRLYLGISSLNQILQGWIIGYFFYEIYKLNAQDFLNKFINEIILKTFTSLASISRIISIFFVGYLILFGLPMFLYIIRSYMNSSLTNQQEWYQVIQTHCKYVSQYNFSLGSTLIECKSLSITFSVIFTTLFTRGEYIELKFNQNFLKLANNQKVLRVIIIISILLCYYGLSLLFFLLFSSYIMLYLFENALLWLLSYSFIALLPFLYSQLGVDIEGDLFRCNIGDGIQLKTSRLDLIQQEFL